MKNLCVMMIAFLTLLFVSACTTQNEYTLVTSGANQEPCQTYVSFASIEEYENALPVGVNKTTQWLQKIDHFYLLAENEEIELQRIYPSPYGVSVDYIIKKPDNELAKSFEDKNEQGVACELRNIKIRTTFLSLEDDKYPTLVESQYLQKEINGKTYFIRENFYSEIISWSFMYVIDNDRIEVTIPASFTFEHAVALSMPIVEKLIFKDIDDIIVESVSNTEASETYRSEEYAKPVATTCETTK